MYPGIELRLYRYVSVLAEELNFTQAALRLSCDPNCYAILQLEQIASEALRLVDPMKLELNAH